jgi:hypothetical protein
MSTEAESATGSSRAGAGATAGELPNLVVIGAMKCGTSSLHYYLALHPEIAMSGAKELNFFLDPEPVPPPGCGPRDRALLAEPSAWDRGIAWYVTRFDPQARVRGESSVAYSFPWYPTVAERMADLIPDAKLVYCVRHPIERIASHLAQFRVRDGRPTADALAAPGNPYVEATRYASALGPFLDRFGRERILLVRAEDLLHRRKSTMEEVFGFLEVDPRFWSKRMELERNPSASKGLAYRVAERARWGTVGSAIARCVPRSVRAAVERRLARPGAEPLLSLEPELARRVLESLEPEIARLEELTGWDLASWRKPASSGVG